MNKLLAVLASVSMFATFASSARAEDYSLHLDPAAAIPLGIVEPDHFRTPGIAGEGKLLVNLHPNFAIGPAIGVLQLAQHQDNTQDADFWTFNLNAQVQGNHNAGWYPYLNVGGGVGKTGSLFRPDLTVAGGVNFAVEQTHTFWVGPTVQYQHGFDETYKQSTALFPHHDSNTLMVGVELAFDMPVHPVVQTKTVPTPVVVERTVVQERVVSVSTPAAPVAPAASLTITERVSFAKDSAAVDSNNQALLDAVAAKLAANPGYSVVVQGMASSEGDAGHNLDLSYLRANAVVDYLANHGNVARTRMSAAALGAVGAPNDASNRSVGFVVFTLVKN